ncbi:Smr/MutS family protein [Pandoraea sp. XJJ-1]|uniref:DNA mismatch repair protein MutS n=1 Tax=Pandoraea cepalis TaxID=2508294 RepID=A0A5E4XB51_9BURK|nr:MULTISPECIES: Smr/MutS family protein [Pandoraea]MDN4573299.1 DNA mismatch repair protein MutS [Pandoraea cepalis]MDN4577591.1 DNA mismatch repair protein MutS [Pandoraea cepalis]OJY22155.1 MAG: DNA mismatch repair protein MutS [Pandoraea sp. 64-18]QBC31018.1 DNA mismatch repair protein MutS [Pandoraea sp. XY-2]WAL83994.1 Smr/MutS family protein [Pandoraea sp. XJJ-1]
MSKKPPRLGLGDLAGLRDAIAKDSAAREAERLAAAKRAAQAKRDANVFRDSVGDIAPIARKGATDRVEHPRQPPEPVARQTQEDEAAVLHESLSDEFDPEALLDTDDRLSYRRPGISHDALLKLQRGEWVVQAQIDLHGMRRDEAREALSAFLNDAVKRGLRCVRVIHGKGLGSVNREPVLKDKVRGWLAQKDQVLAWAQAQGRDGGSGALVVLLQGAQTRAPRG